MIKESGKDVYILGDSETSIFPVTVSDDDGNLDYVGIVFSNQRFINGMLPQVAQEDLVIGFRSVRSIDTLVISLDEIRSMLLQERLRLENSSNEE